MIREECSIRQKNMTRDKLAAGTQMELRTLPKANRIQEANPTKLRKLTRFVHRKYRNVRSRVSGGVVAYWSFRLPL